jgi:cell fate regulator YaaT (PSP1 superfamily)
MTEIISVRFKNGGKEYYFNPNGMQFQPGQNVIIETARGVEFGECTQGNSMVDEMTLVSPLRPVLRAATPEDLRTLEQNKKKEERAFEVCEKKIAEHDLDMKLVDVEYNFEGSKILFFFTSDGRVDFRDLVKDLASVFHTRIELRQIGVRDEAKMLGGLGVCGRPFCCSEFLEDFQPVSIKMAKTQSLSLNPIKISGVCGRLMCCLKYEQDAYEDALKRCPKNESLVETPDGVGTVCAVNLLREQVKVRLDQSPENPQSYPCEEIRVVRSGKGKRPEGYELEEPAPKEPRLKAAAPATPAATPARPRNAERKGDPFGQVPATIGQPQQQDAPAEEGAEPRSAQNRSRSNRKKNNKPAAPAQTASKQEGEGKKEGQSRRPRPKKAAPQEGKAPEGKAQKEGAPRRNSGNNAPANAAGNGNAARRRPRHKGKPKGGTPGAPGAPKAE